MIEGWIQTKGRRGAVSKGERDEGWSDGENE